MKGTAYCMTASIPIVHSNIWIIDTGASSHMCCNKDLFSYIAPLHSSFNVALPNKQLILVKHIGIVILNSNIIFT